MDEPNRNESAWARARSATGKVYRSTEFEIAFGLVTVVVGAFAVLIGDGSTKDQIASAILITTSAVAFVLLFVFAVQLALAPVRQRDELRAAWNAEPVAERVDVELSVREYARIAQDNADSMSSMGGYTRTEEEEAERFTQEVVRFFSRHAPSHARAFIECARAGDSVPRKMHSRAAKLQEIADQLGS